MNDHDSRLPSERLRALAALTACITGAAFLFSMGLPAVVMSIPLLAGAALAGRWPRAGLQIMGLGALMVSLMVFPFGISILLEMHVVAWDRSWIAVIYTTVVCLILTTACDIGVIVVLAKSRVGMALPKKLGIAIQPDE